VVHHTSKGGRKADDASAANVRGSSALTDNARWVAELRKNPDTDEVSLSVTKSNYSAAVEPAILHRADWGGLEVETPAQAQVRAKAAFQRAVDEAVAEARHKAAVKAGVAKEMGGDAGTTGGTTEQADQSPRPARLSRAKQRLAERDKRRK
jgi:hypothetical protein